MRLELIGWPVLPMVTMTGLQESVFLFSSLHQVVLDCRPHSSESCVPKAGSAHVWNPSLEQLTGNVLSGEELKFQQGRNLANVPSGKLCEKARPTGMMPAHPTSSHVSSTAGCWLAAQEAEAGPSHRELLLLASSSGQDHSGQPSHFHPALTAPCCDHRTVEGEDEAAVCQGHPTPVQREAAAEGTGSEANSIWG